MYRFKSLVLVTFLAVAGVIVTPLTVQADELPDSTLATVLESPDIIAINVRTGPGTEYETTSSIPSGTDVQIGCWAEGSPATGPYGETRIWYTLAEDSTKYVSDAFLWTGSPLGVTQHCGKSVSTRQKTTTVSDNPEEDNLLDRITTDPLSVIFENIPYDRNASIKWARDHVYDEERYEEDCTWFVSQALWAGGVPKTSEWTDESWNPLALAYRDPRNENYSYPAPTRPATHADYFKNYMLDKGLATIAEIQWSDNTAGGARLGDVIGYDWNNDGRLDHLALVTDINEQGYPFVTEHTPGGTDRYWSWSPSKNDWYEAVNPSTRAYLLSFNMK